MNLKIKCNKKYNENMYLNEINFNIYILKIHF